MKEAKKERKLKKQSMKENARSKER